jgi:hypothetical protein
MTEDQDPHPPELLSTPEAARFLGVPEPEFTRLASALELPAARAGSKTQPRLWQRTTIEALNNGPEGAELREAVLRKQQIAQVLGELTLRYPQWREAVRSAADALFSFNRFAKWARCSRLRCRELYDLKDAMIRLLYEGGYCCGLAVHTVAQDEPCAVCEGAGIDWQGLACARCAGSGTVPSEGLLEYLAFCFQIDGHWYHWHLPRKSIYWAYELRTPPSDAPQFSEWQPLGPEKPIALAPDEFLQAEALIRFVLRGYAHEGHARQLEERQKRYEENRRAGLARQAELRKEQSEPESK